MSEEDECKSEKRRRVWRGAREVSLAPSVRVKPSAALGSTDTGHKCRMPGVTGKLLNELSSEDGEKAQNGDKTSCNLNAQYGHQN